jgi:AcrR family transcriptional regulator
VERAGVSRRTFYETFDSCEDCFLATFDEALERVSGYVLDAYQRDAGWAERIRASLIALLQLLDHDHGMGRLVIVESLGSGAGALRRRGQVLAQVIAVVDEGRAEMKAGVEPPPLSAEGVVGGVLSVLHARLLDEDPGPLIDLTGPLMGMIVLPYLGPAAARRELARPVRKGSASSRLASRNPLNQLEMRLTYRTVRVLMAVAAHPGSSNRLVADTAGVSDQGQMSKLLARLQGLGLVENSGAGPSRGEPNAWTLTDKGWQVQGSIAGQSTYN